MKNRISEYWKQKQFRKEVKVNFILFSFVTYFLIFFKTLISGNISDFSFLRLLMTSLFILPALYLASIYIASQNFDSEDNTTK